MLYDLKFELFQGCLRRLCSQYKRTDTGVCHPTQLGSAVVNSWCSTLQSEKAFVHLRLYDVWRYHLTGAFPASMLW